MNKIVLVPEDDEDYGVYNASGEVRAVLNDTTVDHGIHAANGAYRVTYADEGSGVYATDGSYNFWYNTDGSINFPGGILKGISETDLISELYAVDGTRPAAVADFEAWRFFIPQLGPELVTNGTFDTDSDWTKGSGVTISGGTLNADSTLLTNIALDSSGIVPVVGKLYLVVYTVTAVTNASGGVSITFGGAVPTARTTTGTFSEYITAVNTETIKVYKRGASQWAGSIDNVSVREVMLGEFGPELVTNGGFDTDTAWVKGSGWTISGGKANKTAGAGSPIEAPVSVTPGKTYKLEYTISNYSAGAVQPDLLGVTAPSKAANGTYVEYITCGSTVRNFWIYGNSSFVGSIDNVSLREAPSTPTLRECTFDEWFTYTSSTPAAETYTDQTGVIRTQTYKRNLLSYSEQFDNAAWVKESGGSGSSAVVTSNAGTSPNNTLTADRIQFSLNGNTTAADRSEARQVVTTTATTHTLSFWVRSFDGVSSYQMFVRDSDGTVNALVVTGSWQRYEIAKGTYPAGSVSIGIGIRGDQTPTNSDSADILIYGAQLEEGSSATTYKPTTSNGAGVDTPRQDYSSGSRRLLLENASTNICLRSEDFSAVGWVLSQATVTLNAGLAPNGTNTANKLVENTVNSQHYVIQNMTFSTGVTYTGSVYFKPAERTLIRVLLYGSGGDYYGIIFDANDESVSTTSGGTTANQSYKIESLDDGWYRISVTCSQSATTVGLRINLNGANTYTGDGTSGFYIWGAQVEASSFPSSYIPTQGSTVTRAINTARFSPMLEAIMQRSAASILVRSTQNALVASSRVIGTNAGFILMRAAFGDPSQLAGGSNTSSLNGGVGVLPGPFGSALAFNSSGRSISSNGGAVDSDTSAVDSRFEVYLSRGGTVSNNYGDARHKLVAIYPTRLSDASLQALAVA